MLYLDDEHIPYILADMQNYLPNETLKFYNSKEIVLGMRGHAQMIPFGLGCRIISLGSHPKMKWFLEDIHCADLYVDLNENQKEVDTIIYQKFLYVNEEHRMEIDACLAKEQERLWEITMQNKDNILLNIKKSL